MAKTKWVMFNIILVRHGFSEGNIKEVLCGQTDVSLTETGLKQGELLSEYIYANYNVGKIYSSTLKRAVMTVKRLSELTGIEIVKDKRLCEMNCGLWEMKTPSWIEKVYPKEMEIWRNDFSNAYCNGGETFREVYDRACECLDEIIKNHDGNRGLVVATHGGVVRALECKLKGLPYSELQNIDFVSNASVTVINVNNGELTFPVRSKDDFLGNLRTDMFKI